VGYVLSPPGIFVNMDTFWPQLDKLYPQPIAGQCIVAGVREQKKEQTKSFRILLASVFKTVVV
jgi:hypothetical protein